MKYTTMKYITINILEPLWIILGLGLCLTNRLNWLGLSSTYFK